MRLFGILVFLVLYFGFSWSSVLASSFLDDGLVAYWKMNETAGTTAADSTGNGNTAEVQGPINWVTGKFGNAFNFHGDGVISYMSVGSTSHIPVDNSSYTISAWIKSDGSGATQGIVGWGNYGNTDQVTAFRLDNGSNCADNNGLNTYWWDDDIIECAPFGVDIYDGEWHHVLSEFDGTERKLFLDDTLIGEDTPTGTHAVSNTDNFAIGLTAPFFDEYFNGSIDDLRIYDRALSDSEIESLYTWDGTDPADPAPTSLGNGPIFMGPASALPGYVAPRPQIVYPDGRIVYLDATDTAPLSNVRFADVPTLVALYTHLIEILQSEIKLLR